MTILSHRWKSGANSSNATASSRDLTAELWVESDDPLDTGHSVLAYLIEEGFIYGAAYDVGNDDLTSRDPINTALYQIDAPQLAPGSATLWSVTLHYRLVTRQYQSGTGIGGELAETPVQRRAVISLSTVARTIACPKAIYRGGLDHAFIGWQLDEERPISNSAGVLLYPVAEKESQNYVIRITRNFARVVVNNTTFPETWINSTPLDFDDGLLKVSVSSFQLKMLSWTMAPRFEENMEFLEVTFEGEITRELTGWRLALDDVGLTQRSIVGSDNSRSLNQIIDGEGIPVTTPVALDGAGEKMPESSNDRRAGIWSIYQELDIRSTPFFTGIVT